MSGTHAGRCAMCKAGAELNSRDMCAKCDKGIKTYLTPEDLASGSPGASDHEVASSAYAAVGAAWKVEEPEQPKRRVTAQPYDPQSPGVALGSDRYVGIKEWREQIVVNHGHLSDMRLQYDNWLAEPFAHRPKRHKPTGDPAPRDHYFVVPRHPRTPWAEFPWQRSWWQRSKEDGEGTRPAAQRRHTAPVRLQPIRGKLEPPGGFGVAVRCLVCLGAKPEHRHDMVCTQCYGSWRKKCPWDDWEYRWFVARRRANYRKESNDHLASLDTAAWVRGARPPRPPLYRPKVSRDQALLAIELQQCDYDGVKYMQSPGAEALGLLLSAPMSIHKREDARPCTEVPDSSPAASA